jgi:hypothetical protein
MTLIPVDSVDAAIELYFKEYGENAAMPANYSDWDEERNGWLLENTNGPLALVREDGTVSALN